ncbi:hypothetical protein H632_c13p4 [Helicosporidium sp. ATCC 50920]|nr:hypothetical protein H632_c13p4 [Helicosporidium sp. ATCC 50920]|eukprot:KDD77128.1 hypothetical protein H632_c13p4 [Helicosporidium sp. ATCC 50920]
MGVMPRRGPPGRRANPSSARVAGGALLVFVLCAFAYVYADAGAGRRMLESTLRAAGTTDVSSTLASLGIAMSTSADGMKIAEYCQSEDSSTMAQHFLNQTRDVPFWTACPSSAWLDAYARLSPTGSKTMVDIGCNKGYSSAKFFALWAPEVGFAPNTLRNKRPEVNCGTCGDCSDHTDETAAGGRAQDMLTVYCVEPSMRNFANLILTRDAFFGPSAPERAQWYVVNAAVSNRSELVHFPRGCIDELCSLEGNSDGTRLRDFDYVQLTTVDEFVTAYEIDAIDVLKIDTEGYDATVLRGAMQLLSAKKVGLLSFEYHEVGAWREYSLKSVVEQLDGLDYVCYYDGKPELSRLTGCWSDKYEAYAWSNVACVQRHHPMYAHMERMTSRFARHKAAYYQEAAKE